MPCSFFKSMQENITIITPTPKIYISSILGEVYYLNKFILLHNFGTYEGHFHGSSLNLYLNLS